jgi:hypothetical protein
VKNEYLRKMYKILFSIVSFILISFNSVAQKSSCILAGIRLQKTHNLYYENGISLDYSNANILEKKLHFEFNFITSRLGSAINSNALKQDNYLLSLSYLFRNEKLICPVVQLNTGYFYSDMEEKMFESIPHTSFLFSSEMGLFLNVNFPVKIKTTIGYNFITGDGVNGPGTLFPLFYELSIYYQFNINKK